MNQESEIYWYSNIQETLAYNLPNNRWTSNALGEMIVRQFTEAEKDYDYLKEKLDNSVLISKENLEKVLALMDMHKGDTVEIFFDHNHPVFFEQKEKADAKPKVRAIIAPRIRGEEL